MWMIVEWPNKRESFTREFGWMFAPHCTRFSGPVWERHPIAVGWEVPRRRVGVIERQKTARHIGAGLVPGSVHGLTGQKRKAVCCRYRSRWLGVRATNMVVTVPPMSVGAAVGCLQGNVNYVACRATNKCCRALLAGNGQLSGWSCLNWCVHFKD